MNDGSLKTRLQRAEVRVIRPGEAVDLDREDAAYWLRMTPEERVEEAWRLSEELWEWKTTAAHMEKRCQVQKAQMDD